MASLQEYCQRLSAAQLAAILDACDAGEADYPEEVIGLVRHALAARERSGKTDAEESSRHSAP